MARILGSSRSEAPTRGGLIRLWSLAGERKLAQIGVADADKPGRLAAREMAQGLLRRWRKQPLTNGGELRAEHLGVVRDQVIEGRNYNWGGINEILGHLH